MRQRDQESESETVEDLTSRNDLDERRDFIHRERNEKEKYNTHDQLKKSIKTEEEHYNQFEVEKRKSEPNRSNRKPKRNDRETERNERAKTTPNENMEKEMTPQNQPTRRRKKNREKSMTERKDFEPKEEGRLHKSNVERNCLTEEMEKLHSKHERLRRERQARLAAILKKEESLEEALASDEENEKVWVETEGTQEDTEFLEHIRNRRNLEGTQHSRSNYHSNKSHSSENRRVTNLDSEEDIQSPAVIRKVSTLEMSSDHKPSQEEEPNRIKNARKGVSSIDRGNPQNYFDTEDTNHYQKNIHNHHLNIQNKQVFQNKYNNRENILPQNKIENKKIVSERVERSDRRGNDNRSFPSASRFRKKKSPENFREEGNESPNYLNRARYRGFSGRNQRKFIMESDIVPGQSGLLQSRFSGVANNNNNNNQIYQVKSKNQIDPEYSEALELADKARGHRKVVSSGNENKESRENHEMVQAGKKFSSNRTTNLSEIQDESLHAFEDQKDRFKNLRNELYSARTQFYKPESEISETKAGNLTSERDRAPEINYFSQREQHTPHNNRMIRNDRNSLKSDNRVMNQARYIYQNLPETEEKYNNPNVHLKKSFRQGQNYNSHLQKYNIKNVASIEKADSRFGSSRFNNGLGRSREPTKSVNRFHPDYQMSSDSLGLDSRIYLRTGGTVGRESQEMFGPFGDLGSEIILQIQDLKEKYQFQKTKFRDFYRTTKSFIQKVQEEFHLVFSLMLDQEGSDRRNVIVTSQSQDRQVQRFFKKRENIFNELLQNMVFLVCTTQVNATKNVLQSLFEAVSPGCPLLFLKHSFETHINSLDNLIKGNVSDVQEVQSKIQHSICYFADKLKKVRVSGEFNASSFQVKAQIYSNKMGSRKGTIVQTPKGEKDTSEVIRNVVVQLVLSNSDKFAELVLVQGIIFKIYFSSLNYYFIIKINI